MHKIFSSVLLLIVVAFLCSTMDGKSYAGAGYCNTTGSTESDIGCGYLYQEEIQEDDREDPPRKGIDLYLGYDVTYDDVVQIGFDATEVNTRSWGNNDMSNFTWTFDVLYDDDPSIKFEKEKATFNGTFIASNSITGDSTSFSSNVANFTIDDDEAEITSAYGYKFETPVLISGAELTNAYGLYLDAVNATGITNSFGIYQNSAADNNYFAGNIAVGGLEETVFTPLLYLKGTGSSNYGIYQDDTSLGNWFKGKVGIGTPDGPAADRSLQIVDSYATNNDNHGISMEISQTTIPSHAYTPGGFNCVFDYSAEEEWYTIIVDYMGVQLEFTNGSNRVTTDKDLFESDLEVWDWIAKTGSNDWYVVTDIQETVEDEEWEITLERPYEGTSDLSTANGMVAAYRMYGLSSTHKITNNATSSDAGATASLRGIIGTASIEGDGEVLAGVGARGGITMNHQYGHMGVGACLSTYTNISDGYLDNWYGLGIESPIFSSNAYISKEIVGVGIGKLLRLAEEGSVDDDCKVYALKIKAIDPEGNFTDIEKYCIYQEGDEPNYLGGSLEVNGSVKITGTSKVRYYLGSNQSITANTWEPVEFSERDYDQLEEYTTLDPVYPYDPRYDFTAEEEGYYDIDTSVLFIATSSGEKLELRIMKIANQTETEYSYETGDGYYSAGSPSTLDDITLNTSDKIYLLAGEKLRVEVKASAGKLIGEGLSKTYLAIHRLS